MLTKIAHFLKIRSPIKFGGINMASHSYERPLLIKFSLLLTIILFSPTSSAVENPSLSAGKPVSGAEALLHEALNHIQNPSAIGEISVALVPKYITQRNEPEPNQISQFWGICITQEGDLIKKAAKLLIDSNLRTRRPNIYRPIVQQIIKFDTKDNHSYEFYISKEDEKESSIKGIIRLDGLSSVSIVGEDIMSKIYELAGEIAAKSECTSYPKGESVQ